MTINRQFKRYFVVGGFSYICEMLALLIVHDVIGLSSVESVAISFWVGFVIAFVLQKYVTFKNHDHRTHILARQLGIYSLLVAWNYFLSLIVVRLLDKHLSVFIIRTLVIIVIMAWNYFIYKRLFKTNPEAATPYA